MRKNYGIGYVGSKNQIAEKIIADLPGGENLYDIFAGGCAITHCASLSGKWQHIHANDINPGIMDVFRKSINGEITPYMTRWVSREEFFNTTDPVIKTVWSFGNNNKTYIYSEEKEPIAEKMFKAVSGEDYEGFNDLVGYDTKPLLLTHKDNVAKRRLLAYKIFAKSCIDKDEDYGIKSIRKYIEKHKDDPKYQFDVMSMENIEKSGYPLPFQQLPSLEKMERMQSLQSLQSLERLNFLQDNNRLEHMCNLELCNDIISYTSLDFSEVQIKPNSIIYCDPPYLAKVEVFYDKYFNQPKFFDWCQEKANEGHQVYISGYEIIQPNFLKVNEYKKNGCFNRLNSRKNEVLYKVMPDEKIIEYIPINK